THWRDQPRGVNIAAQDQIGAGAGEHDTEQGAGAGAHALVAVDVTLRGPETRQPLQHRLIHVAPDINKTWPACAGRQVTSLDMLHIECNIFGEGAPCRGRSDALKTFICSPRMRK